MLYESECYANIKKLLRLAGICAVFLLAGSCSSSRFVPEGHTVLSSVKIKSDTKNIKSNDYRTYIRQEANSRWFNLVKVPLGIYCLSGTDSTKAFNRFMHRIGEPPVIYDRKLTALSCNNLVAAMQNNGFLHAAVDANITGRKGKTHLTYHLQPGERTYVRNIHYHFDSPIIQNEFINSGFKSELRKGMTLDGNALSNERNRMISFLRNKGYYYLHKEFISFQADTAKNDYGVDLTVHFSLPPGADSSVVYKKYRLQNITIYEDVLPGETTDTTKYKGIKILYRDRLKLLRRTYNSHIYIRPDSLYREIDTRNTYRDINELQAINYSTIRFQKNEEKADRLDCNIVVKQNKPHTIGTELEGTNTSGNIGAALVLTYDNRNVFKGAENLSLKFRGAYEAITELEGYSNMQNYTEYSFEAGLRFPTFLFPFLPQQTKQNLHATSEISFMYDLQDRPEFHRRLLTGAWTYRWSPNTTRRVLHKLDLLSLNYIFMPWISKTFRQDYLENNDPRYDVLRNSYENLFIMRLGYNFVYNSISNRNSADGLFHANGYQLRLGAESAGNLLYGLSHLLKGPRDKNGQYNIFDIAYSQYVKFDIDYSRSFLINDRNSIALHAATGIAIPYGNSDIVPYEKRYFSGGANSVRGWGVREIGPGSYSGNDEKIDFINQTGNIRLDLSIEYRTQLFWKLHGAAFIDAGNIWNTKNYAEQSGGQFLFNTFYKQIAAAYGLGIRLNLDYFILRFDGGMKAINPATPSGKGHYPLIHPRFHRDFTFHFAVGLPF